MKFTIYRFFYIQALIIQPTTEETKLRKIRNALMSFVGHHSVEVYKPGAYEMHLRIYMLIIFT